MWGKTDFDYQFCSGICCPNCRKSFATNDLYIYTFARCGDYICEECRQKPCGDCNQNESNINPIPADKATQQFLQLCNETPRTQAQVEPRQIRILLWLLLAIFVVVICLTAYGMIMARRNVDQAEAKLEEIRAETIMQSQSVSSSPLPNSFNRSNITVECIGIRSHTIARIFHHLRNIFRNFFLIILSNQLSNSEGLKLGGDALLPFVKDAFHSLEEVAVDISDNPLGDAVMFALPGLPEAITVLNMTNTAITNLGLANLKGLFPAALELLKPSQNSITAAGLCVAGQNMHNFITKVSNGSSWVHILFIIDDNPIEKFINDIISRKFSCKLSSTNPFCSFKFTFGDKKYDGSHIFDCS